VALLLATECFGGVSSDLPFKTIQILQHHGIIADKYFLSSHSVNLFIPIERREAAALQPKRCRERRPFDQVGCDVGPE
jgi:hypothetical protein